MSVPRVIHWRDLKRVPEAVYVGRAAPRLGLPESPFGNPFKIGPDGGRADVIERYRSWILGRPDLLLRLRDLRGRPLACWCAPEACHGDVIAGLVDADELLDELTTSGLSVDQAGDRLRLQPAEKVDEALLARVRPLKTAILDLLSTRAPAPDAAELWRQAVESIAEACRIPDDILRDLKRAKVKWR